MSAKISDHHFLHVCQDISHICKSLFNEISVDIVNVIRVKSDGSLAYFCDNYDWLKHYLNSQYPKSGAFENNQHFSDEKIVPWSALSERDSIVIDSREIFNINHGITLIEKTKEGYDYFNFGTSNKNPGIMDTLSLKQAELQRFILYFYDKARHIIEKSQDYTLQLNKLPNSKPTKNYLKKRLYLGPRYEYHYLTAREIETLSFLVKGYNVPDIAKLLAVSNRTIETHIDNIKAKLGCTTQCQLGYIAGQLGINSHQNQTFL